MRFHKTALINFDAGLVLKITRTDNLLPEQKLLYVTSTLFGLPTQEAFVGSFPYASSLVF
jgi:hypothetical protein